MGEDEQDAVFVVGDIPSAYLPITDCDSPAEVFKTLHPGMSKWVEFAAKEQTGTADQGVPPVNVPSTPEWAETLKRKLHGLSLVTKPFFGSLRRPSMVVDLCYAVDKVIPEDGMRTPSYRISKSALLFKWPHFHSFFAS
jgi:hypothetical protein